MTIQEAIDTVDEFRKRVTVEMGDSTLLESLQVVVAASRAYSCERCGGAGWHNGCDSCPDCLDARKYLKEHAK